MIFPVQGATAAVNSDNVVVTRIDVAGTKIKGKKKKLPPQGAQFVRIIIYKKTTVNLANTR